MACDTTCRLKFLKLLHSNPRSDSPMSANSSSRSKGEKLARRLSHILSLLHQGDAVDKHRLADEFDVDVRTIERDLSDRLCNIAERNEQGGWQLTHSARSTIPAKYLLNYAQLVGTQKLFPDTSLRYLLEQLEDPNTLKVHRIEGEDLKGLEGLFATLQDAIERRMRCRFEYSGKPRLVEPYRLRHKDGVWYLAAVENDIRKNYCLSRMSAVVIDNTSHFQANPEHQAYIDSAEDIWFTKTVTEVKLRVSPAAAKFFTRKPLLPAQQHRADADGSLLITAQINHPNQLLPVVRYWLPHVRILHPLEWHDILTLELEQTLAKWGTR